MIQCSVKRRIARIAGNFGLAFFGPLIASGIAQQVFHNTLEFSLTVAISAISATFTTGLAVSRELLEYGGRNETETT